MRTIRFSSFLSFAAMAIAVTFLGGCGRGTSTNGSQLVGPQSVAPAPTLNAAEEALKPVLGKYQVVEYNGGTNAKGTLEVVVKDVNGVSKAGIVVTKDASSAEALPNEEKLSVVSQTTFTTKTGTIKQKYVDPTNENVHLEITYKTVGNQLVINTQDCNDETCQLEQFKVVR